MVQNLLKVTLYPLQSMRLSYQDILAELSVEKSLNSDLSGYAAS